MAFRDVVLADGPLAYWRLGEAAASATAQDETANNLDGTVSGATLGVAGALVADPDTAASFDGVDDQVALPAGVSLALNSPVTIEFWIRTAAAGGSAFTIGGDSAASRCQAHVPYTDNILYWDYGDNVNGRVSTDFTAHLGVWTHVVLVSEGNGGTFRGIYLNGALAASVASSDGPDAAISGGAIGAWPSASLFASATIDEFAVYASVLSAARIGDHYNAATTGGSVVLLESGDRSLLESGYRVLLETSDTTAPATPAGLVATAGDALVALDWAANTEPDLADYLVEQSTDGGTTWVAATGSPVAVSALTVTGLANGTTYHFRVAARDTTGNTSAFTASVSATPQTAPTPPPPTRSTRISLGLHVNITSANGTITELHDNHRDPGKRPQGLRFTTARADGFRDCQFRLARRADRDHTDVRLWDEVHVISDTGEVAWEGYVAAQPRQVDDAHSVSIDCVGWMATTKDRKVTFLGIDRDLSRWTAISRLRRTALLDATIGVHDPAVSPDATSGLPSLALSINSPPVVRQLAGALYDAGPGNGAAQLLYTVDRKKISVSPWRLQLHSGTTDDDYQDPSSDLLGVGVLTSTYEPAQARRYLHMSLDSHGATDSDPHEAIWRSLAVVGDHGLPLIGADTKGLSASDVISHVVQQHVPQLRLGEIRETGYPIQQLAPAEAIHPYELMLEVNKYHRFGLEVWEDRRLHYTSPDLSTHQWEIQTDDPEHPVHVGEQGESIDGQFNGIAVTWDDFFGARGRVTPDDDIRLAWSDPEHEATRHGRQVWDEYQVPHRTVREDAIQMAREKLAEANLNLSPGTFTLLSGRVKDRARTEHPAWKVRAGQTLAYVSHPDDQPRLITETAYDNDSKTMTVSVDNALATFDGVVDRWTTELAAAGLG